MRESIVSGRDALDLGGCTCGGWVIPLSDAQTSRAPLRCAPESDRDAQGESGGIG
jgi:hypothetical protein